MSKEVSHHRLFSTLQLSKSSVLPRSLSQPTPFVSPLVVLLDNIYYFPLSWRKYLVDFCRIQADPLQNVALQAISEAIQPRDISLTVLRRTSRPQEYHATFDEVEVVVSNLLGSISALNILSYFARAERSYHVEEFRSQIDIAFMKEFGAATDAYPTERALDYEGLFGVGPVNLHRQLGGNINPKLHRIFQNGLRRMKDTFATHSTRPILPFRNGTKNVATQTQENYCAFIGLDQKPSTSTLDLLRLYMETGYKTPGPMEVRLAWFFNDLKPRIYYANGGDSYFSSLYIHDIATIICNILPSTHPDTRFEVSRLQPVGSTEFVITYDYSSFTSSLSELQYFLFSLAAHLDGVLVDVYDPREGIVSIDLGQYIHQYNEAVNQYCLVSAERFDKFLAHPVFRMGQSGALGAKGNITLSTALHGIALAAITGTPEHDCVVGDDALAVIATSFFLIFVSCVNSLGSINLDKFNCVKPRIMDPTQQSSFKFIKRPLSVDDNSRVILGRLDFFPDIASILYPEGDGFHSLPPGSTAIARIRAFVSQVCRYSLLTSTIPEVERELYEQDIQAVVEVFKRCYEKLGLPVEGHPPGFMYEGMPLHYFIPPLDSMLLSVGWVSQVYSHFAGTYITVPEEVSPTDVPFGHEYGQSFYLAGSYPEYALMEDLGFLYSELCTISVLFDSTYLPRLYGGTYASRETYPLRKYTVLKCCPHYHDLVSHYFPDICRDRGVEGSIVSSFF